MSNLDLVPKKKNFGIIAVALIVIIVGAASFYCLSSASATPTMSSLAGTYSSSTGYTIVLYANGTGLFSSHSGTWSIVNSTTFEGTYTIISVPRTDYFTIKDNGFIAVQTGNAYVKTTSASPTPTESPTPPTSSTSASASPTSAASASPTPTAPEFSTASLALIVTMIAVATCTVALTAKKAKKQFSQQAL
jgi:hypothetical protein